MILTIYKIDMHPRPGGTDRGYATGSSTMTGIWRGAAFVSYSAKPGATDFCLSQIWSRSSPSATRDLT